MADRRSPNRLQDRTGVLLAIAAAVAFSPLALAIAVNRVEGSFRSWLLMTASLFWLIALAAYRSIAFRHERWQRGVLSRELAESRRARFDTSEAFQDRLNEQAAIVTRIIEISSRLLEEGIIDPALALRNIGLIHAHASDAHGLVEEAVAEARIETGSASFNVEPVDVRSTIEDIARTFIRSGNAIGTHGSTHFAATDDTVLRLVVRGLVGRALAFGAAEVDITVTQDGDRVVCTVADNGPDRSGLETDPLPPVAKSLAFAVGGSLRYTRALGWNQFGLALPVGEPAAPKLSPCDPVDVLGERSQAADQKPADARPEGKPRSKEDPVAFTDTGRRDPSQTVAAKRKAPVAAG